MTILVTGGAGYIGSNLSYLLSDKKIKHFVVDDLSTGNRKLINKKIKFFNLDIGEKKKILPILKRNKVKSVFHLAASILVNESMHQPNKYYSNNVIKLLNFLDCCMEAKIKNFVFSSTCAVYDDNQKTVSENSKINPKSIYGKTKLIGEDLIKNYSKRYGFKYAILRYFNVIGADTRSRTGQLNDSGHLFMNIGNSILKKKYRTKIYGSNYMTKDGTGVRDYIDVEDISKIHIDILNQMKKNNKSYELNCGTGKSYSVLEIIKAFEKSEGIKLKKIKLPKRSGDIEEIKSNVKKLKKVLNYKFSKNLSDSIKTFMQWKRLNT